MKSILTLKVVLFSLSIFLTANVAAQNDISQITQSIFFGGGSYYIDDEQAAVLSRWLDSIPNLLEKYEIQIISYTDNIGGKRYNQWLSQMRSQTVHGLLIQKNIPEKKIHIKDWGMENPVYDNNSHQGVRMNRRVDVVLLPIVM